MCAMIIVNNNTKKKKNNNLGFLQIIGEFCIPTSLLTHTHTYTDVCMRLTVVIVIFRMADVK